MLTLRAAHGLLSLSAKHRVSQYDGAGDIENVTNGFVQYADLADGNLQLPRSDWVFSTDVGEHIPHNREALFVRNLHAHNRCGIILSWAALNQRGNAHINNHSPEYLKRLWADLGYFVHNELTADLRGLGPLGRAPETQHSSLYTPGRNIRHIVRAYVRHSARGDHACGRVERVGLRLRGLRS